MTTAKPIRKVFILGIDAATFQVINPLLRGGYLPNIRQLMAEGVWGALRSTIPPRSAPAWAAFMTGKNPGKLGIYDFYTYDINTYSFLEPQLTTSTALADQTFWDILGKLGYRVGIITVPMTYPPWEVNGFMISGWPCPDTKKNYTYPPELATELDEPYNFVAAQTRSASLEELVEQGYGEMEKRTDLAIRMLRERHCDLLCVVLGAVDMAQHLFWKYSAPTPSHRQTGEQFSQVIPEMYRRADHHLGRVLQMITEDTLVFVLSDHGGGPAPTKEVNINSWLRESGWLRLHSSRRVTASLSRKMLQLVKQTIRPRARLLGLLPRSMRALGRKVSFNVTSVDWSTTQAYRFPMAPPAEGLVINMVGRQPKGVVAPGEPYERLRGELQERISQIRDQQTGSRIVERVYRREDLFSGKHLHQAPDLVIIFKDGYAGGTGLETPLVTPRDIDKVNGDHTLDGILLARGKGIRRNHRLQGASILDLAPTILYSLGVPIPTDMDGKVLQDIFEPSFLKHHPVVYTQPSSSAPLAGSELTSEEEETMKEKLRILGYLS